MSCEDLHEKLRFSGLKYTKQRFAILDILQQAQQPLAAEQIYSRLSESQLNISLSTVYRALDVMSEKDLVTKVNIIQDDRSLYELNCGLHRHYLYCLGCNKIITIRHCPLEDYEQALTAETGYQIVGHKLSVYGYCPDCQKQQKKE
ncbi:Ferric uptake regulation protein [bioreactor metagenome]|uniref:Ferric uptake regulation protein n=1 Tax=bioreactor metagenome TaxID=1076179 RepID=A0A645IIN5_9ZZZZ|nr:Fur family transcriptional regulator [Erysipelotrichaceae bacterium]